jgi:hypothetical protein
MCDCYSHKCAHRGCRERIPMHLEDFLTLRREIRVYCGKHLPTDRSNGRLWRYSESFGKKPKLLTQRCFVRWLTRGAREMAGGNTPNVFWVEWWDGKRWCGEEG